MSKLENIAEILPEGISEATVAEICTLVGEVIEEQVGEQVTQLNAKVNAFLRTKIDVLKEQAMAELQEESETYRNARIFESIKSLVAFFEFASCIIGNFSQFIKFSFRFPRSHRKFIYGYMHSLSNISKVGKKPLNLYSIKKPISSLL